MTAKHSKIAWQVDFKGDPICKMVYLALSGMADKETNLCWPSRTYIAARCGCSLAKVANCIKKLEALKLIRIGKKQGNNGYECNRYEILGVPVSLLSAAEHRSSYEPGSNDDSEHDCPVPYSEEKDLPNPSTTETTPVHEVDGELHHHRDYPPLSQRLPPSITDTTPIHEVDTNILKNKLENKLENKLKDKNDTYSNEYVSQKISENDNKNFASQQKDEDSKQEKPKAAKTKSKELGKGLDFSSWPEQASPQILQDWFAARKLKRAPVSQTVINRFGAQLEKAARFGISVDECLAECITRGWQGFQSDWLIAQKAREALGINPQTGRAFTQSERLSFECDQRQRMYREHENQSKERIINPRSVEDRQQLPPHLDPTSPEFIAFS